MATCQACGGGVTDPDRFCRNCGAPVAASFGDSVDTSRFTVQGAHSAVAGSSELTNPFYAPPSGPSPVAQSSARLYQTGSILKRWAGRKVVWLALLLLVLMLVPVGLGVGRSVVRARRAERYERAREVEQARQLREARRAEIARLSLEQAVTNALGFVPAPVSAAEFPDTPGIFVATLTSDYSPAALANIQAGDVLTELNARPVRNGAEMTQVLDTLKPGSEVAVRLYRDGQIVDARMRIADKSLPPLQPQVEPRDQGFLGIGNASRRCCIPGTKRWGLEVRRIVDNSPADLAGLQLGDLITEFDKYPTLTPDEFARRIHLTKPRSKVKVKFYRGNTEQTVELILGHGWPAPPAR